MKLESDSHIHVFNSKAKNREKINRFTATDNDVNNID